MSPARVRLLVAVGVFAAWLGWLGYAVSQRGGIVVSRAQLTGSSHWLVAEVSTTEDGLPASQVKVVQVLRGTGVDLSQPVEVLNLPAAMPPGANGFPGPGTYLLPLIGEGKQFRIAGLPRSPGYEAMQPARPILYPWTESTRTQLAHLGVLTTP